jgi:hypothetical protein
MAVALKINASGSDAPRRKSFVDFLNLVRGADSRDPRCQQYACQKALEESYSSGKVVQKGGGIWQPVTKAAMAESSGLVGGYLLPIDYSDALLNTIVEESFIFPRATIIPMFSREMQAPRVDVETVQTAGTNALLGGINFVWGSENAGTEVSDPTFRLGNFTAWDLLGYCVASNQWLQDAGAIQATPDAERPESNPLLKAEHYLIKNFGRAAAWYAELAFLQGTGTAQQMPLGVIKAPSTIQVARNTANLIKINDIVGMTSALLPYSWGKAVWACSPSALAQIQQLVQYFINVELGGMYKVHPKPCGVLSTFPLFITDKLPPMGTPGDLVLFDPSLYIIGMRQEVVVDVSPDDAFKNNQTTYRVWMRLDGKPMNSSPITLVDGITKASPFIALK